MEQFCYFFYFVGRCFVNCFYRVFYACFTPIWVYVDVLHFFPFSQKQKSANFFLGFGGIAKRLSHTKKKVRTYARNFTQLLLWLFFFWRFSEWHKQSVNTKLCLNKIISSFPFLHCKNNNYFYTVSEKWEFARWCRLSFYLSHLSATSLVPISLALPAPALSCWRGRVGKRLKVRK